VKTQRLRDWLEIIGLFSVVASLIFVGLQLKQTQEIAIASQYQARSDTNQEFALGRMQNNFVMEVSGKYFRQNETIARIAKELEHDHGALSDEELGAVVTTLQIVLKNHENLHYQNEIGFLEDESYLPLNADLRGLLAGPLRHTYRAYRNEYRASFQSMVDHMLADIEDGDATN